VHGCGFGIACGGACIGFDLGSGNVSGGIGGGGGGRSRMTASTMGGVARCIAGSSGIASTKAAAM
jgi:hypothetical protein